MVFVIVKMVVMMNIIVVSLIKIFLIFFFNRLLYLILANCTLKCNGTNICLSPEQICNGKCDCFGTCSDEQNCIIRKKINLF